jgi:signal transduction histidine kinase
LRCRKDGTCSRRTWRFSERVALGSGTCSQRKGWHLFRGPGEKGGTCSAPLDHVHLVPEAAVAEETAGAVFLLLGEGTGRKGWNLFLHLLSERSAMITTCRPNMMSTIYANDAMNLVRISDELRLFCMPMNLLVVFLLAGSYATLLKTHPVESENERRFLWLAMVGWFGNLSYIIVEIVKYRLDPLHSAHPTQLVTILNSVALSLSTIASVCFLHAAMSFLRYSSHSVANLCWLGVILAISTFLPVSQNTSYLWVLVPNVAFNAAAIIFLARAVWSLTMPILGVGQPSVTKRLVYPLRAYAAIQLAYLLLWIPAEKSTPPMRLAVNSVAGAVGFSLAFLCKLVHLSGVVGYSSVRTNRLQRLDLEEKTIRSQQRFISEMVHELNTPAAELNLQLDRLQSAVLTKESVREEAKSVREVMARLLSIIYGAYDLVSDGSKSKKVLATSSNHNVNNVLQSAILSLKATLHEQGNDSYLPINTQLSLKPIVNVRRAELMQVFINVLKNAHEALGESGSIRVRTQRLRVLESPGKFNVVITISDTGSGISQQNLSRVTEDGFSTKGGPGRGHGLAICKRYVEQGYGGKFEISSPIQGGRGTSVKITLPASVEDLLTREE